MSTETFLKHGLKYPFSSASLLSPCSLSSDAALVPQPDNNNYCHNSGNTRALGALETKGQLVEQLTRPVAGENLRNRGEREMKTWESFLGRSVGSGSRGPGEHFFGTHRGIQGRNASRPPFHVCGFSVLGSSLLSRNSVAASPSADRRVQRG